MIDAVVEYAAGFDPSFASQVRACAPDELKRLTALIGGQIPEEYLEYLERVGASKDPFALMYGGSMSALDMIAFYEEPLEPGEKEFFDKNVIVGLGPPSFEQLVIERAPERAPVHFGDGTSVNAPLATSLERLLYHSLFDRFAVGGRSASTILSSLEEQLTLDHFNEWLSSRDFERVWFSDPSHLCSETTSLAAEAWGRNAFGHRGVAIRFGGDNRREVETLTNEAVNEFNLRRDQVS